MKTKITDSQCRITLEESDGKIERYLLNCFALRLLSEDVKTVIIIFEYGYKYDELTLSLLFNSIFYNQHIKCLSIQGCYNLNYNELKCLKDKSITLELKHGINADIDEVTNCAKAFKSITHLELGTVKSTASEQQVFELLQALEQHHQLCSLVLPLPNTCSQKLILVLCDFLNTKRINKFGFSSFCNTEDVLAILSKNTTIQNLGFAGINDLTENKFQEIFNIIKGRLKLKHFTMHKWSKKLSHILITNLSQLPCLESILLDCGNNVKFVTGQLPDLIRANLNLRSIEILHMRDDFTMELKREDVLFPQLFYAADSSLSLTNLRILEHEDCKHVLFPDDAQTGVSMLRHNLAVTYCSLEIIERNKVVNDLRNPNRHSMLNWYIKNRKIAFDAATVKPANLDELRVPSLYDLSFQKALTFFRSQPYQVLSFKDVPVEIREELVFK